MTKLTIALALFGACGKKTDSDPAAAKPAEAAKPTQTAPAPAPTPAPAPAAPAAKADPAKDKELVTSVAPDKSELEWTSPSGGKVKVAATKHLVGNTFAVDLVIDGKVIETVTTGAEKPDANGFTHYEPKAYVAPIPEGVLFVAGTTKVTGKPDDTFDARVLTWDGSKLA